MDYRRGILEYSRTDLKVKRVLRCLTDYREETMRGKKTLEEVTKAYKRMHPAPFMGLGTREETILSILEFLVAEGLVRVEIFTYTYRPLRVPIKLYSTTNAGDQELSKKR